jgi:predicted RecA/RadA family phage recombinase
MAKLIQNAGCYDWLNSGETAIPSGAPVVNGSLFGFAIREIKPGELGAIQTDGIWDIPITANSTASVGDVAYWDATNSKVITTASTNLPIGRFTKAVVSTDTTCQVMINVGEQAASAGGSGSGE